jgi:hypothetical protein
MQQRIDRPAYGVIGASVSNVAKTFVHTSLAEAHVQNPLQENVPHR